MGDEAEDAADPANDTRTTSRAQRAVFKSNRHLIDKEDWERVQELMLPTTKCAGKQNEINKLINKWVPRGSPFNGDCRNPDQFSVEKTDILTNEDMSGTRSEGMGMYP